MSLSTIKTAVQTAIGADGNALAKWQAVGALVAKEYPTRAGYDAIKAQFVDQVIVPALGADAVRIMGAELARKNSTEYKERVAAHPEYAAQWETANTAKRDIRATAHTYFTRIGDYAYGKPEKAPAEPRSLKTRTLEELAALVKAHQKDEMNGDAQVIAILNKAIEVASKMK